MKRRELLSLEVKAPVQERYNEYLQRKLDRSVWSVGGCKSGTCIRSAAATAPCGRDSPGASVP